MKNTRPFYIYELRTVGLEINKVYYGSTQQKYPYERIGNHFRDYNRYKIKNIRLCYSFNLIQEMDNENVHVVVNLLDYVPYEEGRRMEGWYMKQATYDKTIECVNHNIAGRTGKEYYHDNKEKKKQYYEANKEKIRAYQKEYNKAYYQAKKEKLNNKKIKGVSPFKTPGFGDGVPELV
jgi:hypothetical protein